MARRRYRARSSSPNPVVWVLLIAVCAAAGLVGWKLHSDRNRGSSTSAETRRAETAAGPSESEVARARARALFENAKKNYTEARSLYRRASPGSEGASSNLRRAISLLLDAQVDIAEAVVVDKTFSPAVELRQRVGALLQEVNKNAPMIADEIGREHRRDGRRVVYDDKETDDALPTRERQKLSEKDYLRLLQGKEIPYSRASDPNWEGDGTASDSKN